MKNRKHILITLIMILFLISGTSLYAQQAPLPNIGDALKQAAPPPKETPAKKEAPEAPVIIQEEMPFSLPEGQKLFIKDFIFDGAPQADIPALSSLLDPYKGKELTMTEITEAANKVTVYYRDRGYMVAKAYIPRQDATNGILTIKIIVGNYGSFFLKNSSLVKDFFIWGVFDKAKKSSPLVTRESLEGAMLLVKDMPGASMPTVSIAPGMTPGTSDFTIAVDKSQRFSGYIMGDNQGSKFTGKERLYAGFDVNSPFGIADKFSLSAMTSDQAGLQNGRISYAFPLGYNGLRTEFAASRTTYELRGIFADLDAQGTADILEGTLSYPLRRNRDESMDLSLNLAHKELKDELRAVDVDIPRDADVATFGFQRTAYGTLFGRNLFTTLFAKANIGTVDIRDDVQKALNEAGVNNTGTYSKFNLGFLGNLAVTEKLSLQASLKLQKALTGKNLDSSEQLFISGTTGVKSYPEGISGDNGYVASAEAKYGLPSFLGIRHALGVFADNAYVYAQNGSHITHNYIMLSDAGVGYYVSFKGLFGSIQLAHTLGPIDKSSESDSRDRVLAQVGLVF